MSWPVRPLPALAFCGAALIVAADQATKEIVHQSIAYGERIPPSRGGSSGRCLLPS